MMAALINMRTLERKKFMVKYKSSVFSIAGKMSDSNLSY